MPTRAPSMRRLCCLLAAALALVLGLTPRAGAKPPDLPASIIPDCAPTEEQPSSPAGLTDEELEGWHEGLTMGDRCAAMRTFSRCVLFALNPLSAVVRPDRYCEFDEEAPFPVIRIGDSELSVRSLLCDAAVTVCSGPFGPFFSTPKPAEEPKSSCPAGGMMPDGNYCPQTHECPGEMKCPGSGEPQSDAENEARARKVQELLIAAQLAAHMGDTGAACAYYRTVCELCPGTCCAWEAAEHIRSLQLAKDSSTEDKQEEEQNVCPSVKEPTETPPPDPDKALEERLKSQAVSVHYEEMPLSEVLDQLRKSYKINIFVDNLSLQKSGIGLDQMVSIKLENVCLRSALNLTLRQLHLVALVKEGVVVVTTPEAVQGPLVPQVYRVADLVKVKKGKARKGEAAKKAEKLVQLIQSTVAPKSWAVVGGPGTIMYFPRKVALVVSQDKETHEQIGDLLAALRRLEAEKDSPEGDTEASEYDGPVITAYDISDLMTRADLSEDEDPAEPTREEIERGTKLMTRIKEIIAPEKWTAGTDTLQYFPETRMLVVRQPQEIQEQVANFLSAMRESSVKQVSKKEPSKNAQGYGSEAVYSVSDLLTTYGVDWDRKTDRLTIVKKTEDPSALMRLIQEGVAPESWACHGGQGTIRYESAGTKLIIQQTAEVQQAIREFLDARRREIELHKRGCERHLKACKAEPENKGSCPFGIWCGGGQVELFEDPASCLSVPHNLQVSDAKSWGGAALLLKALTSDPPATFTPVQIVFDGAFGGGEKRHDTVSQLLDGCHKALKEGRLAEAEMFASRALSLDPVRVKWDPMVTKMLLLNQVLSRAVTFHPLLPAIDFNIVRAYNELLGLKPPPMFVEVHETGDTEECEDGPESEAMPRLFLDQSSDEALKPSLCLDIDQHKGRLRCQLQLGLLTICFLRDEDGHNSVELSLPSEDQ